MLTKMEITLLKRLNNGDTISDIAGRIGLGLSRTSELVHSLQEKGFINLERKGKEKIIIFSESKHSQLFREILGRFGHIDFSSLLNGSALKVIFALDDKRSISEIAVKADTYRPTVYRNLKRLMDRGIVGKVDSKYFLLNKFKILNRFSKEFFSYHHLKKAEDFSEDAVVVWENLNEFIVKTEAVKEKNNFMLTGFDRFGDCGIPLLVTKDKYYFYTEKKDELKPEDILIHTLLIDPMSTRHITFCLLLMAKQRGNIDKKELIKQASFYNVEEIVESLFDYLESKGEKKLDYYPTWEEFSLKASEYGVKVNEKVF